MIKYDDATLKGPAPKKQGTVIIGQLDRVVPELKAASPLRPTALGWGLSVVVSLIGVSLLLNRRRC